MLAKLPISETAKIIGIVPKPKRTINSTAPNMNDGKFIIIYKPFSCFR